MDCLEPEQTGGEVLSGRPVSTDGWGGMPKFRPITFFHSTTVSSKLT